MTLVPILGGGIDKFSYILGVSYILVAERIVD